MLLKRSNPGSPPSSRLLHAAGADVAMEPDLKRVKLVVLGSRGSGKSSIVQQFVRNSFSERHEPTRRRQCYFSSVVINEHVYEVKITDCPVIARFPSSSLSEWSDFRGMGLRYATGYVLVYDVTSDESFHYVRTLREQILDGCHMSGLQDHQVPILVVGNKCDLLPTDGPDEKNPPRREPVNVVRKQWKCPYVECSAKFNWHIVSVFKELMKLIYYIDYTQKPTSNRVQDVLCRDKCVIL